MQFLGCRKMLPYKWLWLMLRTSVASMKGSLRRKSQGKNRAIRSFADRSLRARAARAKVLKILVELRCLVLLIRPIDCFNVAARNFDAHKALFATCRERGLCRARIADSVSYSPARALAIGNT